VLPKCKEILGEFILKGVDVNNSFANNPEVERLTSAYVQIVLQILRGILDFYDEQFLKHLPLFYGICNELIMSSNKDIRLVVRDIFVRIGKMKNLEH